MWPEAAAMEPPPGGPGSPEWGMSPRGPSGCCEERLACLAPGGDACAPCAPRNGALAEVEHGEHHREALTEDDIYCRCLSKTLCHTATPVTVGFYAPCGHRLFSLLDKVTGFMREEMEHREEAELRRSHQKPRSPEGWGLLMVLWYLAFYKPIITESHLRRKNIQFIFIRFSAWQYAGCDKLWAGLVTTLCDSIRHHFGALPLSVYHVMGTRPRFASGFSQKEWVLKRSTCLKLWALLFVLSVGLTILLVALLVPGIKDHHALKVVGSAVTSLSGSSLVLGAFSILKNLLISEKQKIERLTNSEKFTTQLGFMSKVRREVEVLVDFLTFMEIFERRRLRVVLEITSLDICYPEKVAGVLNAMNTLLSDTNVPFIFILAVDPSVIVPCLEQTGCMKGLADNGYLYLNRTVTLPFSIPEMGARSRLRCLEAAIQTREDLMYGIITGNVERRRAKCRGAPVPPSLEEADAEAVRCIHEAFHCLHDGADPLARYLPTNGAHLRRIVNTIPITLRLLLHRAGTHSPRSAAAWVLLADQWPCRLSWALQCLEDSRQSWLAAPDFGAQSLWSIFQENLGELSALQQPLRNVLSLDGDPELFQTFLAHDFPFTAHDAHDFLGVTVNLDHSIRHKMGLLRGLDRLKKAATASVSRGVQCPHPE
ncbi:NTPase KAP family P-loop domain-containing protein 1 [Cuculus canorus]|uniref:NTPase KAP family P-loop domain-containing protein 1 n=1 Tax=Cuculus canorus TaxID=55661 RepID=UPI0023AA4084|nr:NTPase KAP family P-loop domain-containing protein 1 [Cuculus canorus]